MLGSTWKWKSAAPSTLSRFGPRAPSDSFLLARQDSPATLYFQRRGIVVITSENYDGEWIARIITKFGYGNRSRLTRAAGRRRCCRWSAM
jgi:hypothetical protein